MSSPVAPALSSADQVPDRRAFTRLDCSVPVRCRSRPWWLLGITWPAILCNASARGICLHTQRPEDVGSVLFVELDRVPQGAPTRHLRVRVLHARETPILRDWVLGCALQGDELSEDELRCLMS